MFITFEGIEGCGKTTQITRLEKRLTELGIPLIRTLEPGGTDVGAGIRRILLDSRNSNMTPLAELILYAADRAQHVEEVIRPALERGSWVLCDRFSDATVAYQGYARRQDRDLVRYLNETATGGIRPDLTILLDCPVDVGIGRAVRRNASGPDQGQDRFEREREAFHREVRSAYLELARNEPDRIVVVDAEGAVEEVEERIFRYIGPRLREP